MSEYSIIIIIVLMAKVERVVDQHKRLVKLPQQVLSFRASRVEDISESRETV